MNSLIMSPKKYANLFLLKDFIESSSFDSKFRELCKAPFSNLFFRSDGSIGVCCFNRNFVLGKYPKNKIEEVWSGQEIKKMRSSMRSFDLSKGCIACECNIKDKNFAATGIKNFEYLTEKATRPTNLQFELSNTCNLKCIMCNQYFSSSFQEKSNESLETQNNIFDHAFIEQIIPFIPFLKKTDFLGGEPFLIDIYYEIWEQIIRLNPDCIIYIQTNGTILNNKIKELLGKGNFRIGISLEALDKELYEAIRINSRFEKLMDNLSYFQKYSNSKGAPLNVSTCIMQQNWKEIPKMLYFFNKERILVNFNTIQFPFSCTIKSLPSYKINEIIYFLSGFHFSEKNNIAAINSSNYFDAINQLKYWHVRAIKRESIHSNYIKNSKKINRLKNILYRKVYIFIMEDYKDITPEERQLKYKLVIGKLDKLIDKLPEQFPLEKFLSELSSKNIIKNTISQIDNFSENLILELISWYD